MTLEEAIQHCNDKAAELNGTACGIEHKQLRDWLEELKKFREVSKESAIIIDGVKHTLVECNDPEFPCIGCSLDKFCRNTMCPVGIFDVDETDFYHFEILRQE